MNSKIPSRVLNESKEIMGLNFQDLAFLGIGFLGTNLGLKPLSLDFFSSLLVILAAIFLIPIRLRFRRKIVRDFVSNLFSSKVIYDPRNSRRTN